MNPLDIQQQLADQRRGRYVRVSDVDRRLLIDTYKKGEDFIALAKKLNIKRSTGEKEITALIVHLSLIFFYFLLCGFCFSDNLHD